MEATFTLRYSRIKFHLLSITFWLYQLVTFWSDSADTVLRLYWDSTETLLRLFWESTETTKRMMTQIDSLYLLQKASGWHVLHGLGKKAENGGHDPLLHPPGGLVDQIVHFNGLNQEMIVSLLFLFTRSLEQSEDCFSSSGRKLNWQCWPFFSSKVRPWGPCLT